MTAQGGNSAVARTLRDRIEPLVGQVYFAPECHEAYAALGFAPSAATANGVALPDGPAYFTSRGSVMGQVAGEVVAAAFGVFNPAAVVPAVEHGWRLTDAATICAARHHGAVAQLDRVLGGPPEGIDRAVELLRRACEPLEPAARPLFAGVLAQPWPGDPLGELFHAGDLLREFRGDAHNSAWTTAGLSGVDIGLLTERYLGLPPRSYIRTRAWSEAQLDASEAALRTRGWIDDTSLTPEGHAAREAIEVATDLQMEPATDALGADAEELFALLQPWGRAVVAAGGYVGGAGDLAGRRREGGS